MFSQTTLMNLLSGDLVPTNGEQRRSFKLRIGRYAQHFVDALDMDVNPVEYLLSKYPVRKKGYCSAYYSPGLQECSGKAWSSGDG